MANCQVAEVPGPRSLGPRSGLEFRDRNTHIFVLLPEDTTGDKFKP